MEEEKLLAWSVATASCLCLCPPLRGEVSCIICVPSSAQTSLEVGHIWCEKASAATEYYAMYWVSSYGDKVDFNLGVCGGNLLNSTHFYWQVATNNPSKSDPIKFSFIKLFSSFRDLFYFTLVDAVACTRTTLVIKNYIGWKKKNMNLITFDIWPKLYCRGQISFWQVTEFLGEFLLY